MTTAEWIGVGIGCIGLLGAFAAWIISTFQTKESARIQETAITAIVESAFDRVKSAIDPIRDDISELKKKLDTHLENHAR